MTTIQDIERLKEEGLSTLETMRGELISVTYGTRNGDSLVSQSYKLEGIFSSIQTKLNILKGKGFKKEDFLNINS